MELTILAVTAMCILLAAFWIWQRNVTERQPRTSIDVQGQTGGEARQVRAIGRHGKGGQTSDTRSTDIKVKGQTGGKADYVDAIGEAVDDAEHGMIWKDVYNKPVSMVLCKDEDGETDGPFFALENYNMRKHPKGLTLIVNNYKFKEPLTNRDGTEKDATALNDLFNKMGFTVIQKDDLTAKAMKDEFSNMVKQCRDGTYNCFCGIILSHGEEGGVLGTDNKFVKTKDIMDMFHGKECPGLLGKPKLFFIQACQGADKERGCDLTDSSTVNDELLNDMKCETDGPEGRRISGFTDFFLAVSTVPGYVSYRHTVNGSYFITAMVTVFSKLAAKYDLLHLMTSVNNEVVSLRSRKEFVQVSKFESTLTKAMYFFPGLPKPSVTL